MFWTLASAVLSLRLWLVGSCVGCLLVEKAPRRGAVLPVERSSSPKGTNVLYGHNLSYILLHQNMAKGRFMVRVNTNRVGHSRFKKIWSRRHFPLDVPQTPSIINLVMQSSKDLVEGGADPSHSKQTQLPCMNARWSFIYACLPSGRNRHKVFFIVRVNLGDGRCQWRFTRSVSLVQCESTLQNICTMF